MITEDIKNKLQEIARKHEHKLVYRNPSKYEVLRMFGDQIDSRLQVDEDKTEPLGVSFYYTFWVEGEHEKQKYPLTLEEVEECLKEGNKEFKKEVIDRDEDPEDW